VPVARGGEYVDEPTSQVTNGALHGCSRRSIPASSYLSRRSKGISARSGAKRGGLARPFPSALAMPTWFPIIWRRCRKAGIQTTTLLRRFEGQEHARDVAGRDHACLREDPGSTVTSPWSRAQGGAGRRSSSRAYSSAIPRIQQIRGCWQSLH